MVTAQPGLSHQIPTPDSSLFITGIGGTRIHCEHKVKMQALLDFLLVLIDLKSRRFKGGLLHLCKEK